MILFFVIMKYNDKLKRTWPDIPCEDVKRDLNHDLKMMKKFALMEYYHIFVNIEGKKSYAADELSTDNMQCYCD